MSLFSLFLPTFLKFPWLRLPFKSLLRPKSAWSRSGHSFLFYQLRLLELKPSPTTRALWPVDRNFLILKPEERWVNALNDNLDWHLQPIFQCFWLIFSPSLLLTDMLRRKTIFRISLETWLYTWILPSNLLQCLIVTSAITVIRIKVKDQVLSQWRFFWNKIQVFIIRLNQLSLIWKIIWFYSRLYKLLSKFKILVGQPSFGLLLIKSNSTIWMKFILQQTFSDQI